MNQHQDSWGFGDFFAGGFGPRAWAFGFPAGGARHRGRGRRQMFESGEMKFVILRLIKEKPSHGYEIIKALEERMAGCYSPSSGTVYPTLQLLEDQGFARVRAEEDGKKTYEITDAGRAHLAENRDTVDSIFERVSKLLGHFLDEPMTSVHTAFRGVGKATYSRATDAVQNPDVLKRIVSILEKAAAEIDAIPR